MPVAAAPDLVVEITADTSRFAAAMTRVTGAARRAEAGMRTLGAGFLELSRSARRLHLGITLAARELAGNGPDAFAHPADWQSPACAAWLHDDCPNALHPILDCRCTCHGGHLR